MKKHNLLQTAPNFHSRALKKAQKEETQTFHFEESLKFRNSIFGIEAVLNEKLKENEMLFRGSVIKKKNLLIDALEDLSLTNFGFSDQIRYVISFWRKPISENMELKLRVSKNDIDETEKQLDELKAENQELDETISNLMSEIEKFDHKINEIKQKTEEARNELFFNCNTFAEARMTKDSITRIQNEYNQIFITPFKYKYSPENQKLFDENNKQKKIQARLQYEARVSNQITNHLKSKKDEKK